jgi:hypothetical protein
MSAFGGKADIDGRAPMLLTQSGHWPLPVGSFYRVRSRIGHVPPVVDASNGQIRIITGFISVPAGKQLFDRRQF